MGYSSQSITSTKLITSSKSTVKSISDVITINRIQHSSNERILVIIPGYSVSIPPKIGDHRYYIQALKYHQQINPRGYKKIYVFDLYSKKDGRCNFNSDIPMLAKELFSSMNSIRDDWKFSTNCEIDFIGASMGGLILRKFLNDYLCNGNQINTKRWGTLTVKTVLFIATPNLGCKIVDMLEKPFIQFIFRILFGKNNFSKSQQVKQLAVGNQLIRKGLFREKNRLYSSKNSFLDELNSESLETKNIRWITIRGTKGKWYTKLIYSNDELNDGVVAATSVPIKAAENIEDKDLGFSWNHRDLYNNSEVCNLLFGLLVLNLNLHEYILHQNLPIMKSVTSDNNSLKLSLKISKKLTHDIIE
ncbi:MAG: hypothetical protein FK734_12710 [Asgard group archaeon]|nr:hypothetical protein [Asgard group archaeon]